MVHCWPLSPDTFCCVLISVISAFCNDQHKWRYTSMLFSNRIALTSQKMAHKWQHRCLLCDIIHSNFSHIIRDGSPWVFVFRKGVSRLKHDFELRHGRHRLVNYIYMIIEEEYYRYSFYMNALCFLLAGNLLLNGQITVKFMNYVIFKHSSTQCERLCQWYIRNIVTIFNTIWKMRQFCFHSASI